MADRQPSLRDEITSFLNDVRLGNTEPDELARAAADLLVMIEDAAPPVCALRVHGLGSVPRGWRCEVVTEDHGRVVGELPIMTAMLHMSWDTEATLDVRVAIETADIRGHVEGASDGS